MTNGQGGYRASDVLVVGGGIAGSSLAAALAGAGLDVVVVEREARFRDRVRGEGLHPWGVVEAERLGLLPALRAAGANPLPRWRHYADRAPAGEVRHDVPFAEHGVYHPALQDALLDHAVAAGAALLRPARAVVRSGGEVAVETEAGAVSLRPRLVVGADGRRSVVRRWLGAETVQDPVHHRIGGCLLDGVDLDADAVHLTGFPGGYSLIFPQGRRRARTYIACLAEIADRITERPGADGFIAHCAALLPDGAFAEARPAGPLAFFPNADDWADRLAGDGMVLVGDAAGANDPSLGHGLSLSFRDARELRDRLLATDDWAAATTDYARARRDYHAVLRTQARWSTSLQIDVGDEADRRRALAARARKLDPELGGFARLPSRGPDGLVADEAARRHYFGEDLPADGV